MHLYGVRITYSLSVTDGWTSLRAICWATLVFLNRLAHYLSSVRLRVPDEDQCGRLAVLVWCCLVCDGCVLGLSLSWTWFSLAGKLVCAPGSPYAG